MTQEEHDRIVANCAGFMGWHREELECVYDGPSGVYADWWCDDHNEIVIRVNSYDPTADTVEGREQANVLKKQLIEKGYTFSLWHWERTQDCECNIHKDANNKDVIVGSSRQKIEGSALAAAVSELVEASKQKEK